MDWTYLVEMASRNKLKPLLYNTINSSCPEVVPKNVLNQLKDDFNKNIRKNLLLSSELMKIMNLLKSKKITAIPYKGPVLALSAYGNIALRQFSDIDILIKESDILEAKYIMISEGYELNLPVQISDSYYMNLEPEYQFINHSSGIIIEIKWKVEGNFFKLPYKEILLNNLNEININDFKVDTFSPNNQLLIMCIHCAKHDWKYLSWICDISEFIKSNDINWEELLQKADRLSIKRIVLINLLLAKDLLDLELPNKILSCLDKDIYVLKISNEVKERFFMEESLNLFGKFILDLRKRERLIYGIKDCINGFVKPTYEDFKDFNIPEQLFFLYYILRPFLLLKRYGRGSI